MRKDIAENDQFPIEDVELFKAMEAGYVSDNEHKFFEEMKRKELYEFPVSTFDVLMSEEDNDDGLYIVKCYYSEYVVGISTSSGAAKLNFVPTSLKAALNVDLFPLLGRHETILDWLRKRDYKGVKYDYEWEE